jgi:hypothetical protein
MYPVTRCLRFKAADIFDTDPCSNRTRYMDISVAVFSRISFLKVGEGVGDRLVPMRSPCGVRVSLF